jgi:NAD(P)-dependent dehydrogenase (short-subunit alcohol dehydrogenase family)
MRKRLYARGLAQEPIGQLSTSQEIAEPVLWLCADRASFIVGAMLVVDGGYLV